MFLKRQRGFSRMIDDGCHRLKPEMASRRLLVLAFVREYFARWGSSPSYGEIAAALATNRSRVRDAVRQLVRAGQLLRVPGPRGLILPDIRDQALRQLRELGWHVDDGARTVTHSTLLARPPLDYQPQNAVETKEQARG